LGQELGLEPWKLICQMLAVQIRPLDIAKQLTEKKENKTLMGLECLLSLSVCAPLQFAPFSTSFHPI
jgi:hypothetical protein